MKGDYIVSFDPKAARKLEKLPRKLAQRIYKKIIDSKQNPHRHWIRLEGRVDYRMRIGDHRAIADIYEKEKTIHVTAIGHRNKIYEKQ